MRIGTLAKRSGCSVQTVRYYEKEGLISAPARTDGNFRSYEVAALERLCFIKNCRALNLTLGEIKKLISLQHIPGNPCEAVDGMIDAHMHAVQLRIADLQNLFEELKLLRRKCGSASTIGECGVLEGLSPKSGHSFDDEECESFGDERCVAPSQLLCKA